MKKKLPPHQQAGRLIRFMAYLTLIPIAIVIFQTIGIVSQNNSPGPASGLAALIVIILLSVAFASFVFFLSVAVMAHKKWARIAGILYGAFILIGFPIGTIFGAFILYFLIFKWDFDPASQSAETEGA